MAVLLRHVFSNASAKMLTIALVGTSILSCLPQRKSSVASDAVSSTLSVKGFVASTGGQPLQGADIYLDLVRDPIGRTGGDGSFKIDMDAAKLSAIQAVASGRSTWNVYAKQPGSIILVGISGPISLQQRDSFDAGTITAQPASSLKGKVVLAAGNQILPGAGALVSIGREQTTAGLDGGFILKDLPSGSLSIHAETAKYQAANETLSLVPGTDISRDEPVVLFQGTGPSAVLFLQPYIPGSASPTTRSFKVKASANAKYIRYYHTLSEMERLPQGPITTVTTQGNQVTTQVNASSAPAASLTPWREIPDVINYSFPTEGPAVLWYQSADQEVTKTSDLMQIATNIDSCSGMNIVLGDGSGLTRQRKTKVTLNGLPSNATRLRISDDANTVTNKPWQSITTSLDFMLGVQSTSSGGGGDLSSAQATRQIFVQVGTTSGECPVTFSSVVLQPFPDNAQMLLINGGAQMTNSRIVQVDLPALPPNAFEMRFIEITPQIISNVNSNNSANSFATNATPWMRAVPTSAFMFQGTGSRVLSVQFRDLDGLVSSNYVTSIDVIPSQTAGFNIAFSQISSLTPIIPPPPTRYLVLQLLPPQNAVAFRYMEIVLDGTNSNLGGASTGPGSISNGSSNDPTAIVYLPWMNLIPIVPVYARGIGLRTFVMQYLSVDGITTTVTQSIFIDQVPETIGDFVINNGEISTLFPTVALNIYPPVDAVAMSATNLTLQQTTANSSTVFIQGTSTTTTTVTSNDQWLSVAPTIAFKLDGRGTQSVQMRFRDPNGNVPTPAVVHSIIYDPFPPFPSTVVPFTINNGAASTTSPLIQLNIMAPESAHSYRVSQDPNFTDLLEFQDLPTSTKTTIAGVPWKVFQYDAPFLLTGTAGPRILYVQFRNELGDRSASLSATINYTP